MRICSLCPLESHLQMTGYNLRVRVHSSALRGARSEQMMSRKPKVLLVVEQCNPEWSSVPLEGFRYYEGISQLADTTLVTHERNEAALSKLSLRGDVVYIRESALTQRYYRFVTQFTERGRVNWPLQNALTYPIYGEFDHQVYQKFGAAVAAGEYDLVHALTPMMPRYPVKIHAACRGRQTPFLLGPVNGGVPFPPGFQKVARQESAQFNFLRSIGRYLIPGYRQTYLYADRVLAGSTYTLNLIRELFELPDSQLQLFYENGISREFLNESVASTDGASSAHASDDKVRLLFVGRLVPYKGADMLLEALGKLDPTVRERLELTIVGDGSERSLLEARATELGLQNTVRFAGWIPQQETQQYYRSSDIFCFPSVREFGGAVVLEAMAGGLPCIVVNNGGIGEYVTEETGFKIDPLSRDFVTETLTEKINVLVCDGELRSRMARNAVARVRDFVWETKAEHLLATYEELIAQKNQQAHAVTSG